MTTKDMEHAIYRELWKQGRYMCFEVQMPDERGCYFFNSERVDLLSYENSGKTWRFFELKLTKSDFHSDAKITFLGHYNYYVMPSELYSKVADEIPDWVGVYVVYETARGFSASCEKRPKKQELKVSHDLLMFALMQSLSRENQKYRKILKSKDDGDTVIIDRKRFKEVTRIPIMKISTFLNKYKKFSFCEHCKRNHGFWLDELSEEDKEKCKKCEHSHIDNFELDESTI